MGNISSTGNSDLDNSKVVLYEWSSEVFPEEYELQYRTSSDDETASSDERSFTLRISANRDTVFIALVDRFGRSVEQVRVGVEVKAERDKDNQSYYRLGVPKVNCEGQVLQVLETLGGLTMDYPPTNTKKGFIYVVKSFTKSPYSSSSTEYLAVSHTCCFAAQLRIKVMVVIECDKVNGLSAKLEGPFKSRNGMAAGGLCIDKLDKCKPQHPIVNRVFKSPRARKNNGGLQASSYEITGAVNNVNARALGHFNQSTFDRCQITVQMDHPSTDKQQANNKLGSSDGLAS